jgi:hypothetical protein
VLVYVPGFMQLGAALRRFPHCKLVSRSPELLLIQMDGPGQTGMAVTEALGLGYRPHM